MGKIVCTKQRWLKGLYHYEYYIEECVLCGRSTEYKIRVDGKRDKEKIESYYHFSQYACGEHFC